MEWKFSWDPRKAQINSSKHGVTFAEASSVFFDPMSLTKPDRDHSWSEERFLTLGLSRQNRLLVVVHCDHDDRIRLISGRLATRQERRQYQAADWIAEMKPEYDFSDGVRGKYADRFSGDCVMVPLDPDVAEVFSDSGKVNEALRTLIEARRRSEDVTGASAGS